MTPHERDAERPSAASRTPEASRRRVLGAAAAATAVGGAAAVGLAEPAAAATRYVPARWEGTTLLPKSERHLVGRFSYGLTPALAAQVSHAGGARAWFEGQLEPTALPDPAAGQIETWWPSFDRSPRELWARNREGTEGGWMVMQDLQRYQMARRMISSRQVHEVMSEFWQHHLNVPTDSDGTFTYRVGYDRTIREQALGRFADLLFATTTHPAMGIYLNNAVSTKTRPNENLGRELLELHSVGRGGYGEDDVKSSARILTGWRVDVWRSWENYYSLTDHWSGPVQVMGFSDPNRPSTEAEGRALTRRYTDYLARHPRTAQRIARKLAVKFVSDVPPAALVARLAEVYLASDTAIRPVLRALVDSPEFAAARGSKVKDPVEDVVSTYRALGVRLQRPSTSHSAVNAMLWQAGSLGVTPFGWPTPDGQPLDNSSWSSPSRMMASMELHYVMSGGWWPNEGIAYRAPAAWLPRRQLRFDLLVDHLAQQVLHRRSTSALLQACCEAVGVTPATQMSSDDGALKWILTRTLTTLLDSPAHLTR